MFACVVAGRPVQTTFSPVDNGRYILPLDNAASINHLTIFCYGDPLPPDQGAGVYLLWPGREWTFLGWLSNDKPSAIFRLKGTSTATSSMDADESIVATLGVSIEPLTILLNPSTTLNQHVFSSVEAYKPSDALTTRSDGGAFAQRALRLLKHLNNYIMSFSANKATPSGQQPFVNLPDGSAFVNVSVFEEWYKLVQSKLQLDPGFLDRESD